MADTRRRGSGVGEPLAMCVVALVLTAASLAHKLSCTSPQTGRKGAPDPSLTTLTRTGCFSDTATLFTTRNLAAHIFPYAHSWYTPNPPTLHGGTIEYPTGIGMWAWASALPVTTARGFLALTALSFVPAVVVTTLCLQRVAGRRAWIWAASPPLALYALYNWDILPVAATTVGLTFALRGPQRWSPTMRAIAAGAAFGVGGAFKLYPAMFVVPLSLAILLDRSDTSRRDRLREAGGAVAATTGVLATANLPFVVANPSGWLSVFQYQATRPIDDSTLSVWWIGPGQWFEPGTRGVQQMLGAAATVSTAVGIITVVAIGVAIGRRSGTLPWVQTAAAMLCVYLLCNKVHSLQYVLWLLPFFVVIRIRMRWIVAYLVTDLAAFVGWYRTNYYHSVGNYRQTWADAVLAYGVWGRPFLLAILVVAFLRSEMAAPPSTASRISSTTQLSAAQSEFAARGDGLTSNPRLPRT